MKQQILAILNCHQGNYISGETISKQLNISRMMVSKHIKKLMEDGYMIQASTKKGYQLSSENDILDIAFIQKHSLSFYHTIDLLDSVDSTNDTIKQQALSLKEGYVLLANEQTNGKGRNGRTFASAKHKGIYMSILLKPSLTIYESLKITACASVAVWEAIYQTYGIEAGIKWVNDLYLQQKKVGGILCEASLEMNTANLDYMIVGIGLNVHHQNFSAALAPIACSIEDFSNQTIKRNLLITKILNNFSTYYQELSQQTFLPIYKRHSTVLHQNITVYEKTDTYDAYVLDIDEQVHLKIKKSDGTIALLQSGEISIRNKK